MKGKCFRIAVLAALFLMVLTQAAMGAFLWYTLFIRMFT